MYGGSLISGFAGDSLCMYTEQQGYKMYTRTPLDQPMSSFPTCISGKFSLERKATKKANSVGLSNQTCM